MGDRGNIRFKYSNDSVIWMYTHWKGSQLPEIVRDALDKGRDRWDDETYLARIVFCTLVGGDDGTTGFGLSPSSGDNENTLVEVDAESKRVKYYGYHYDHGHKYDRREAASYGFEEFVCMKPDELYKKFNDPGSRPAA